MVNACSFQMGIVAADCQQLARGAIALSCGAGGAFMATAVANAEVRRGWNPALPERLPDLKGRWLVAYTALWAAALLVAIVAPISSTVTNFRGLGHPVWRPHGVVTMTTDSAVTVTAVFGDEARQAGIHPGDQVIAVNGWRIGKRTRDNHLYALLDGGEGSTVTILLRSPEGGERTVTLTSRASTAAEMFRGTGVSRSAFDAAIHFFDLSFLLFAVPAALLLFVRRRREIIPALLSLSFLVITGFVGSPAATNFGVSEKVVDLIGDLLGWLPLVLALIVFPDGRLARKCTALALILVIASAANDMSVRVAWLDDLTVGSALVIAGVALVLRYRAYSVGPIRQQLRWAFLGFIAGLSLLMVAVPLLASGNRLTALDSRWAVWLPMLINIFAGLSFPCMALGLMVSVLRYRLYDADTVIGRSAAYGVLTLGFVGLFAGTEKLAEILGERYFAHSIGIGAGAVGAAVAAACIVPLHNRVHRWAERRFQKPLIRLREGLPECVADLRESAPVEQLVVAVMSRVEAGVRSSREAVLLADEGKLVVAGKRGVSAKDLRTWQRGWAPAAGEGALDCASADPLFPLRARLCIESRDAPETIGWLLLGPRPDGSFFGKDEREAIEHVAGPIARAIHIAQLRERRDERAEKRISALEALIERIASATAGSPPALSA
jgi:hypothetical protein